jgi:hypothetical protein
MKINFHPIQAWIRFWFLSDGRCQLRIFRVLLAANLIFFVITRTPDLRFFFGNDGLVSLQALPDVQDATLRFSLFQFFPSMTAIWIGHLTLLLSLGMMFFGIAPRIFSMISFVLSVSFIHRNMAIAYGVDVISNFYLFYLCLEDSRSDAERPREPDLRSMLGSLAYRLAQMQVCIIYLYSGLEKVRGNSWWSGEAIWYVFANSQLSRFDLSAIAHVPVAIVAMTYMTLFWEVYFPVLIWVKGTRYWTIFFGVMLHIGIALLMNLTAFGILMISTYFLFFDDPLAHGVEQFVSKMIRNRKVSLKAAEEISV